MALAGFIIKSFIRNPPYENCNEHRIHRG